MEYLFNSIFVLSSICRLLWPTPLETPQVLINFVHECFFFFGRSTWHFLKPKKGTHAPKFWIKIFGAGIFFFPKAENFDLKKHQILVLLASGIWLEVWRRRDLAHFEQSPRQAEIHSYNVYMTNKMRNYNLHMHWLTPPSWHLMVMVNQRHLCLIRFPHT